MVAYVRNMALTDLFVHCVILPTAKHTGEKQMQEAESFYRHDILAKNKEQY